MCVFISISKEIEALEKRFRAEANKKVDYKPVFQASAFSNPLLPAITQPQPAIIDFYEWGLIPFWVKDEKTARDLRLNTVNAKTETLTEKPSFRHLVNDHRCLVPADGFFEFQEMKGKKYPWYICLKNLQLFGLAGLTDTWTNHVTGEIKKTFTIITVEANPLLAEIHNRKKRMPAILTPENETIWLDNTISIEDALSLLKPYDENQMDAWTVSRLITTRGADANVPSVKDKFVYSELSQPKLIY
ncbi:MAG: SOS response-associated peptidase [Bacteroidia bacterium]|nr:SOS response-associated peptidase [Bacteroidia bacterium]